MAGWGGVVKMMMIMMTVISASSEAAVEELKQLLLLLLGCAVQVIIQSHDHHSLWKVNNDRVALPSLWTTIWF